MRNSIVEKLHLRVKHRGSPGLDRSTRLCLYSHDHLVTPRDEPLLSSLQQTMDSITTYASSTDSEELISSIFDDEEEQSAIQCIVEASKIVQSSVQELSFQGRVPATKTIARDDCSWYRDYLSPHPVYPPSCFREVIHLPLSLYNKVHALLVANEPLFRTRTNAFGLQGHSSHRNGGCHRGMLCAWRRLQRLGAMRLTKGFWGFAASGRALEGERAECIWREFIASGHTCKPVPIW